MKDGIRDLRAGRIKGRQALITATLTSTADHTAEPWKLQGISIRFMSSRKWIRNPLAITTLGSSVSVLEREMRNTYNPPIRNILQTRVLALRDIWRCNISLTGKDRIKMSAKILGILFPQKKVVVLTHFAFIVMSHCPWIGSHEKIDTSRSAIPHITTKIEIPVVAMVMNLLANISR
jgi:hypothetical protein